MKVAMISVPVKNVAEAFGFYTKTLNFKEHLYLPQHNLAIVVSNEDLTGTQILLEPVSNENTNKYQTSLFAEKIPVLTLSTPNIIEDYTLLFKKGVIFLKEPTSQDWGIEAVFDDTCGNYIQLVQIYEN